MRSFISLFFLWVACGVAAPAAAAGFVEHRIWTAYGDQPGAGFGAAVATAGDVNGDGFPDVIVGAPAYDGVAGEDSGKAFVFYGSATGLPTSPSWTAQGERTQSRFGAAVASAGDVNGDAFADVVVGAPGYLAPDLPSQYRTGRIYVYLGSPDGLSPTPVLVADGLSWDLGFNGGLGGSLASGDFNGDGFADVAAGQHATYIGNAVVYYGSPSGPSADNMSGPFLGPLYLGRLVAAGDVNGDSFDDLIVTSVSPEGHLPHTLVFLGSPTGLSDLPPAFDFEQWSNVANVGDLDRDGHDDLLVVSGDPNYNIVVHHFLYRGSPLGPVRAVNLGPVFDRPGNLSLLGDVNGDGSPDAIAQDGSTFYFYFGSPSGFRPLSDGMGTLSATAIGAAGELNGDAFDDIVVGYAADEHVDVYRGGTDWSFSVNADVSVQMEPFLGVVGFWLTVTNHGPDTVRVRLVDVFPPAMAGARWNCTPGFSGPVADKCLDLGLAQGEGDLDSLITIGPGGMISYGIVGGDEFIPIINTASLVLADWVVDPDPSNNQSTAVSGPPGAQLVFLDYFESGDLSAWSSHSAHGLAVVPAAALHGEFGLQVTVPRSSAAVVRDDTPTNESNYYARFQFDPNGFGRNAAGQSPHRDYRATLFGAHGTSLERPLFEISLELRRSGLFLSALVRVDDETVRRSVPVSLKDAPHMIGLAWTRSTGANDGQLSLRLDGVEVASLTGLDNDALGGIDFVRLGLVPRDHPLPRPLRPAVFLDSFESWRLPQPPPRTELTAR